MPFGVRVGGGESFPSRWSAESSDTSVDVHGKFVIRWEIAVEFWPLPEQSVTHCPCIDVIESLLERRGDAVLPCCCVAEVAVTEFVRPEYVQAAVEEVPERVGTVAVLGKNEALSYAGPSEEVDCVAVRDGLGRTGRCISYVVEGANKA